jgi:hypothetical protein
MSNQKRLEEYLIGNDGYLKKDISNGKVIMLSGKWGSGKTHFWQNKIQTVLNGNEKEKKIPNNYISLYGKTTIEEIRNEVFLKIFESMDIFKIDDKSFGLAKNTANLVADLTKTVSVFGFNLDLSKIVDKSFEKLEKVREEKIEKKTEEILNSGAVICFDDFERKSKDIDLNDLFGFITHLAIEFKCKVVIILNDDVFEGEEKKIFSNVKEKSVSKFLKYEPSIKELFDLIFDLKIEKDSKKEKKYKDLEPYKEIILSTIEETQELNARIYIQVLDNLVEWIEKNQDKSDEVLKYLIFVNINFVLYHYIFRLKLHKNSYLEGNYVSFDSIYIKEKESLPKGLTEYMNNENYNKEFIDKLKVKVNNDFNEINKIEKVALLEYINNNQSLVNSLHFINSLKINELFDPYKQIRLESLQKINNFIESGILINE